MKQKWTITSASNFKPFPLFSAKPYRKKDDETFIAEQSEVKVECEVIVMTYEVCEEFKSFSKSTDARRK